MHGVIKKLLFSCLLLISYAVSAEPADKQVQEDCLFADKLLTYTEINSVASVNAPATLVAVPNHAYHAKLEACQNEGCKAGTYSSIFPITIPASGKYHVAVNQMLWIDLFNLQGKVEGTMCEKSGCLPIKKMLVYDLVAGEYWLQLTGKQAAEIVFSVFSDKQNLLDELIKK
jgi:hypothetical protein